MVDHVAPDGPAAPDDGQHAAGARRWVVGTLFGVLVVAVLALGGWLVWQLMETVRTDPGRAGVGDCLRGQADPDDLRRTGCDRDDASWLVVAVVPNVSWEDFQATPGDQLCAEYPDADLAVWYGERSGDAGGELFCLEPLS